MSVLSDAHIAVVVPAYNEARLIGRTLAHMPAFVHRIIVVDDASEDGTHVAALALNDPRVEVVRLPENRGVGAAIAAGYRTAFARGAHVCAVMAGDAQMDPADLPNVINPVLRGEADYVKGDRLSFPAAHRHMPWTRWLGNRVLSALTSLVTGIPIRDSQCGYTALSKHACEQLPIEQLWARYGYPNDMLGMLAERGLRVQEVVVRPVYADEVSGVRLRHALVVVPFVLARVFTRRLLRALVSFARAPEPFDSLQHLSEPETRREA